MYFSSRSTKTTSRTWLFTERPTKIQRSSLSEFFSSRNSVALGSEKAVAASAKRTPCSIGFSLCVVPVKDHKMNGTSLYYQCQYNGLRYNGGCSNQAVLIQEGSIWVMRQLKYLKESWHYSQEEKRSKTFFTNS